MADRLNAVLARDGYRLEVAGHESGYPIYRVCSATQGVAGAPKNLIFASVGPKPEIGFRDAINNDIVILSNAESCLIYDRPISPDGLLWSELVDWWSFTKCEPDISATVAGKSLGRRLQDSLGSDAERGLFNGYFRSLRAIWNEALPALVPQVYLHYDPAVVARLRHRATFPRQRMDFLLLLPRNARVVLEIDGAHHFSRDGRASLGVYADTMRADRDLRLLGYEIYRFGANELVGRDVDALIASFFGRLFEKHRVTR